MSIERRDAFWPRLQYDDRMMFNFPTTSLLRSMGFLAVGIWALTWQRTNPEMVGCIFFVAPAAFGGAVGALLGKTSQGIFGGLVLASLAIVAGVGILLVAPAGW